LLGEFRGKEELFKKQLPQALETLRQAAIIQSTESSNRIEGVTAPHQRIVQLVAKKTKPRDRSEQEIAGYRDVLNTIHANHTHMPFGAGLVLQLHRDMFKFTSECGGQWKSSSNEIAEIRPDGTRFVRFTPVAPHLTEDAMRSLHDRFRELWESQQIEPLLLIPALYLGFSLHPSIPRR
jgi:Fic family protein